MQAKNKGTTELSENRIPQNLTVQRFSYQNSHFGVYNHFHGTPTAGQHKGLPCAVRRVPETPAAAPRVSSPQVESDV